MTLDESFMLTKLNIVSYATTELSHDAFIA